MVTAAFLGLSGCQPGNEIELRVCGDLAVPEQIDALRLSILDDSLKDLRAGVVELVPRESPATQGGSGKSSEADEEAEKNEGEGSGDAGAQQEKPGPAPRSLPVTASLPAVTGSGYLRVQGLLAGVEVARFERRVYDFEILERAELVLNRSCYRRLSCPRGQTCVDKVCKTAPEPLEPPACKE